MKTLTKFLYIFDKLTAINDFNKHIPHSHEPASGISFLYTLYNCSNDQITLSSLYKNIKYWNQFSWFSTIVAVIVGINWSNWMEIPTADSVVAALPKDGVNQSINIPSNFCPLKLKRPLDSNPFAEKDSRRTIFLMTTPKRSKASYPPHTMKRRSQKLDDKPENELRSAAPARPVPATLWVPVQSSARCNRINLVLFRVISAMKKPLWKTKHFCFQLLFSFFLFMIYINLSIFSVNECVSVNAAVNRKFNLSRVGSRLWVKGIWSCEMSLFI